MAGGGRESRRARREDRRTMVGFRRPGVQIVSTFLLLIAAGAVLLDRYGFAGHPGGLAAAFMATSAVCVTGLSVVDVGTGLTFRGQVILLLLIQAGGLGLLTISNFILLSVRGRMGAAGAAGTRDVFGALYATPPAKVLCGVILFTAAAEGAGAACLAARFAADYPARKALWLGVFHSISAFCNAGFSPFPDSLSRYQADPVVNAVVMALVVAGGMGFVVAVDLVEQARARLAGRRRRLSFHSRFVLRLTAGLVACGAALFLAFEWDNPAFHQSWGIKCLEAAFLSVMARTAGFNTVPTGQLTNMSLLVLMVLMFVGASPGSTGGGVKTTTLGVVGALVRARLRNRPRPEALGRSIPFEVVSKALGVVVLYAAVVLLAMTVLQATEFGEVPHVASRGLFLEHLFEVMSAVGTVGLSTGVTGQLSEAGRVVLMACMFTGRIGPLVLVSSLVGERPRLFYTYPEEDLMVG
ncbi:TrkH family potassium uptake protein [Dissulfurirhabdus thermomarina]|nr:potassium transporter TrkG [Dissulfurirhabdus thermomarina]